MFETISHAHHLMAVHGNHAAHLVHATQKLNLVASNTEVYNSYGAGGANEGGNFDDPNHVTPWSSVYHQRPIDSVGLDAEGGPGNIPGHMDTYACDNDGFGCYLYNRQAFDNIPDVLAHHNLPISEAGSAIDNNDTVNLYTNFGVNAEIQHASKALPHVPFFYPPRQAGKLPKPLGLVTGVAAKKGTAPTPTPTEAPTQASAPPPKFCPAWADCTGTHDFHTGEGFDDF